MKRALKTGKIIRTLFVATHRDNAIIYCFVYLGSTLLLEHIISKNRDIKYLQETNKAGQTPLQVVAKSAADVHVSTMKTIANILVDNHHDGFNTTYYGDTTVDRQVTDLSKYLIQSKRWNRINAGESKF